MSAIVKGCSLLNRAINALSFELHISGYQICDPETCLEEHLARDDRGERGINPLDAACRKYDIAYSHSNVLAERHMADNILAAKARKRITTRDSTLEERAAAATVWAAIKAKTKIGMSLKTKKKKMSKRILPVAKRGDILPILPLLRGLGSIVGEAAIVKVVNDNKAAQRQLEELKHHNRVMEDHGLYFVHRTIMDEKSRRKKKRQKALRMPKDNYQRTTATTGKSYAYSIFPKCFRTILSIGRIYRNKSGIINLDNAEGPDTHAYAKRGNRAI